MVPQGLRGAAAAGAPGVLLGAALALVGAGALVEGVTLVDCWPIERPPPKRRAASLLKLASVTNVVKSKIQGFFMSTPIEAFKDRALCAGCKYQPSFLAFLRQGLQNPWRIFLCGSAALRLWPISQGQKIALQAI
jgi:hypothetical protein